VSATKPAPELSLLREPLREIGGDQVLAGLGVSAAEAAMVGDDIESDIGGALRAGLDTILVQTGKYSQERVRDSGIQPTVVVRSIADVPTLLGC